MKLAAVFSDGMVLQRDKEIYIFGESDTSEAIDIEIDDIRVSSVVKPGKWYITLPAHAVGGPYEMVIRAVTEPGNGNGADKCITIRDILYGEVWLDNGQSNIEFEIQNSVGGAEELKKADYPEIRYFKAIKAPVIDDDFLREEEKLRWHKCSNGDFSEMSGIGYFFAQKLQKNLKIPVGIVDCYWGGTSITCWLEKENLVSETEGKEYFEEYERAIEGKTKEQYQSEVEAYNEELAEYQRLASEVTEKNPDITPGELRKAAGEYPWPPPMGAESAFRPCGLIETMMKRVAPYTLRGIIYYQGEEDAVNNYEDIRDKSKLDVFFYEGFYRKLLRRLISQYRSLFRDEALPIVLVQLPMFIAEGDEDLRKWGYLREAQAEVSRELDSVMMVPLIDLGEYDNIHPVDKKTPGERIAGEVLGQIYGDTSAGVRHMNIGSAYRIKGGVTLRFNDTYGGIALGKNDLMDIRREFTYSDDGLIFGLEIGIENEVTAENDAEKKSCITWKVPERAVIDDGRLVIYEKKHVVAVRYAFFDYGKVNLYNRRSAPLAPFRIKVTGEESCADGK